MSARWCHQYLEEVALIVCQWSCVSEGLIPCVKLFIHNQAPRMTFCSPAFLQSVVLPFIFCAATGGHLLDLSTSSEVSSHYIDSLRVVVSHLGNFHGYLLPCGLPLSSWQSICQTMQLMGGRSGLMDIALSPTLGDQGSAVWIPPLPFFFSYLDRFSDGPANRDFREENPIPISEFRKRNVRWISQKKWRWQDGWSENGFKKLCCQNT